MNINKGEFIPDEIQDTIDF